MTIEVLQAPYNVAMGYIKESTNKHWDEVPFGQFQLELDLHDDAYQFAEQEGYLRLYLAVKDDKEVVGYICLVATEMMHHQGVLQAVTDAFYVDPDYRKAGVFTQLVDFAEEDLRSNGIRFLTVGVNPTAGTAESTAHWLQEYGYVPTEQSYTKEL